MTQFCDRVSGMHSFRKYHGAGLGVGRDHIAGCSYVTLSCVTGSRFVLAHVPSSPLAGAPFIGQQHSHCAQTLPLA